MSSYSQYKMHIFDKKKNGPCCRAKPAYPEYAKTIEDINCAHCLKLVEETMREIEKARVNLALKSLIEVSCISV